MKVYIKANPINSHSKKSYYMITTGSILSITDKFGITKLKTLPSVRVDLLEVITEDEFMKIYKEIINLIKI